MSEEEFTAPKEKLTITIPNPLERESPAKDPTDFSPEERGHFSTEEDSGTSMELGLLFSSDEITDLDETMEFFRSEDGGTTCGPTPRIGKDPEYERVEQRRKADIAEAMALKGSAVVARMSEEERGIREGVYSAIGRKGNPENSNPNSKLKIVQTEDLPRSKARPGPIVLPRSEARPGPIALPARPGPIVRQEELPSDQFVSTAVFPVVDSINVNPTSSLKSDVSQDSYTVSLSSSSPSPSMDASESLLSVESVERLCAGCNRRDGKTS